MKKAGFYKKDWFVALLVGLTVATAALSGSRTLQKFEHIAYDAGVRLTHRTAGAAENIAIIAIDDYSIEQIGRWPWPRSVLAELLDQLAAARPRLIALHIFLTEPQNDPGLAHVRKVRSYLDANPLPHNAQRADRDIRRLVADAEQELDADSRLAGSIARAGNVYMPMVFRFQRPLGKPETELPKFVARHRLVATATHGDPRLPATDAIVYPLPPFGEAAVGLGHLNVGTKADVDDGVRSFNLLLEHHGEYFPALPLLLAANSLNIKPADVVADVGRGVRLGKLSILTSERMQMYTGFYPDSGEERAFRLYSFQDVRLGKISPNVFRDKIVLIGSTATGLGDLQMTPIGSLEGPVLTANVVASILNQDFYTRPDWVLWTELALFGAILLYLMVGMPNLSAKVAALVSALLLLALLGGGQFLMIAEKVWLQTVTPALLLVVGHLLITSKRFFLAERLKADAESDSAQNNRMLGLAFQSQGQLDMALDKFRRLPVDESVLELFYSLALDFERKRQFNKAVACYDYVLRHEPGFRDIGERRQRALMVEQTVILGGKNTAAGGTLILDGLGQKPTLGRYEVEKELGKGAMGTVYLGRDPRINRTVAIKTLPLTQEFEAAELEQVRGRFFREAETAGRLSHPNIVTIYDAGEEHDLAYIAMEYLEGKDLTRYLAEGKPLVVDWVTDIVAQVAEALDYAHKAGVVHRDIKPANIMYNEANHGVKVTDFGIARITASTRTKTGVVMGTPSYMSPEQISGKPVDGRSDLFSLGVMLFELLTGRQPFGGDSLATLMYQIANARHPDITELRPEIPACLKPVVDKALAKNPDRRYQTGADMRDALVKCMNTARTEARAR